jgi:hypothetical protein
MNKTFMRRGVAPVWAALLVGTALTACGGGGGGQEPILGGINVTNGAPVVPGVVPSIALTVTTVSPASNAAAVALNTRQVTATFSKAMDPATLLSSSFLLSCPAALPVSGVVSYDAPTHTAVLTLPAATTLPAKTLCVATITPAAQSATAEPLAAAFTWQWTTAATPDITPPTVTGTIHADGATNVATNTKIGATFSEAMNVPSINGASFLLMQTSNAAPVTGSVATSGSNAVFTPTTALLPGTQYTVTAKGSAGGVSDSAGNVMVRDFVWSWTTAGSGDGTAPTVTANNPAALAVGVCTNKTVNATFSEAMDPLSISNSTFTMASTAGVVVNGLVAYDAQTRIASFNPTASLVGTPATSYIATLKGGSTGVKDLAGNALVADKTIRFTTNASTCATAPVLGAAAPFGGFGGNATLTNDGLNTLINGDLGVNASSTKITGLRDAAGNVYTVTPNNDGTVNGTIYTLTAPPGSVAGAAVTQVRSDALLAFNSISPASLLGGLDVSSLAQCPSCGGAGQGPGQLAGRTLPPGVYLSTTGSYGIGITPASAGSLTLDAGGDPNAVWVFQTAAGNGTLTVGVTGPATPAVPVQVMLVNGAMAKNVFWYVPAGASIGTGSTMVGTLLADAAITFSTTGGSPPTAVLTRLVGRAIALTAGVTMTNTIIDVPAP